MSRANKYIDLFEGFKLGSLGVSKKPKVTPPLQADDRKKPSFSISITKEGVNKKAKDETEYPFLFWKESDGWSYCLCIEVDQDKYFVQLFGGAKLEAKTITQMGHVFEGWITAFDFSWIIHSSTYFFQSQAFETYKEALSIIKEQGSSFLLSRESLSLFPVRTGQTFKEWRQEREVSV